MLLCYETALIKISVYTLEKILIGVHSSSLSLTRPFNPSLTVYYYQQVNADNIQKVLASISANKVAEVKNTLAPIATATDDKHY